MPPRKPKVEGPVEGPKKELVKPEIAPREPSSKQKLGQLKGKLEVQQLKKQVEESPDSPEQKIAALKEWFKLNYKADIKIVNKEERFGALGTAYPVTDMAKIATELEKLKAQMVKIPPEFLAKMGVTGFVIAGKLIERNGAGQERGLAASAFPGKPVYFSAAWPLYHEFFHIMDAKFASGWGSEEGQVIEMDHWDFYKEGHTQNKDWEGLEPDKDFPPDENQAEYCHILFNINDPTIREIQYEGVLLKDPGKIKKLERMKQWLFIWSDGKFDEQYWKDLQEGKIVEGYWDKK